MVASFNHPMRSTPELRNSARYETYIECVVGDECLTSYGPARLLDLSLTGARIAEGPCVRVGDRVAFFVPGQMTQALVGVVMWRSGESEHQSFGIRIVDGRWDYEEFSRLAFRLDQSASAKASRGEFPSTLRIFGLTANSSLEEVERVFRQQARLLHPDFGGDRDVFVTMQAEFDAARLFLKDRSKPKPESNPSSWREMPEPAFLVMEGDLESIRVTVVAINRMGVRVRALETIPVGQGIRFRMGRWETSISGKVVNVFQSPEGVVTQIQFAGSGLPATLLESMAAPD